MLEDTPQQNEDNNHLFTNNGYRRAGVRPSLSVAGKMPQLKVSVVRPSSAIDYYSQCATTRGFYRATNELAVEQRTRAEGTQWGPILCTGSGPVRVLDGRRGWGGAGD